MTARRLVLTDEAIDDIAGRGRYLAQIRGAAFARDWADALIDWLEGCAAGGAQLGTEHPAQPGIRTFPFRRQATVLAEFAAGELRVIRVYFSGQDWSQG